MSGNREIARLEALAEEAYTAMYDARRPKDYVDDALLHLQRAIDIAADGGEQDEVERLTKRKDHIWAVYNSQFRWIG